MVHSVYSDKDVFLRELISNAADACERLRYEAIANPALLGDDPKPRITLRIDAENRRLTVEDNGIGMSRDEMVEALGTIARSGTKAFMDRIAGRSGQRGRPAHRAVRRRLLLGLHGGRPGRRRLAPRRQRRGRALVVRRPRAPTRSRPSTPPRRPPRGTRVILHLMEDAASYTERYTLERIVKAQSGHVPVPISLVEKPGAEPQEIADGAALWVKPRAEIKPEDYTDFYRSLAGQFDEPALTVHFRAEGRHEYTALAFVPGSKPFDLFDPDRHGRMKLYVRRVFITDEAEILPRYLRFVRGLVDSADLPLNVSREMIQESPLLAAIKKGVTSRVLCDLTSSRRTIPRPTPRSGRRSVRCSRRACTRISSGAGRCLDWPGSRPRPRAAGGARSRTMSGALQENQTAIYYVTGSDLARLEASPQLEGFRARGVEVLLLPDPVDSFWVTAGVDYEGKPFKSVTQGAADLALIPLIEAKGESERPGLGGCDALHRGREGDAGRAGLGCARVRAADRERRVPGCA